MINDNIDEIEQIHNASLVSFNEQQWSQMSTDLERWKTDTQKRNLDVKNRLKGKDRHLKVKDSLSTPPLI